MYVCIYMHTCILTRFHVCRAKPGDKCVFTGTLIVVPDIAQLRAPGDRPEQVMQTCVCVYSLFTCTYIHEDLHTHTHKHRFVRPAAAQGLPQRESQASGASE